MTVTLDWLGVVASRPIRPTHLILANSVYGELYRNPDGGDVWEKLKMEFTRVRALARAPNY